MIQGWAWLVVAGVWVGGSVCCTRNNAGAIQQT